MFEAYKEITGGVSKNFRDIRGFENSVSIFTAFLKKSHDTVVKVNNFKYQLMKTLKEDRGFWSGLQSIVNNKAETYYVMSDRAKATEFIFILDCVKKRFHDPRTTIISFLDLQVETSVALGLPIIKEKNGRLDRNSYQIYCAKMYVLHFLSLQYGESDVIYQSLSEILENRFQVIPINLMFFNTRDYKIGFDQCPYVLRKLQQSFLLQVPLIQHDYFIKYDVLLNDKLMDSEIITTLFSSSDGSVCKPFFMILLLSLCVLSQV